MVVVSKSQVMVRIKDLEKEVEELKREVEYYKGLAYNVDEDDPTRCIQKSYE